eukprot:gb/GEZN01010053.1/.p1 GENE.gb/GEZN01010053.1/~~gb/GEZN01010053.1/.p1  ORF type:complete len:408 (+),score=44.18 gb/GEZN01010053.1/:19-1242(+)
MTALLRARNQTHSTTTTGVLFARYKPTLAIGGSGTRNISTLSSLALGCGMALFVCPIAEWKIHRDIMHLLPPQRKHASLFAQRSSEAHHDEHHKAYKAPAHYFRDVTNAHAVSTFNNKHVVLIASGAALASGLLVSSHAALFSLSLTQSDYVFCMGFVSATLGYYLAYEKLHHWMHDVGTERLRIGGLLGDVIQAGLPLPTQPLHSINTQVGGGQLRLSKPTDGQLRLSKPTLDALCRAIRVSAERRVANNAGADLTDPYGEELLSEMAREVEANRARGKARIQLRPGQERQCLETVTDLLLKEWSLEQQGQKQTKLLSKPMVWLEQLVRTSQWFVMLDNHHYLHHLRFWRNLNVVLPFGDFLFGTLDPADQARLKSTENIKLWLCPNSPDTEPFVIPRKYRAPLPV